jgi:hypothetical protein
MHTSRGSKKTFNGFRWQSNGIVSRACRFAIKIEKKERAAAAATTFKPQRKVNHDEKKLHSIN